MGGEVDQDDAAVKIENMYYNRSVASTGPLHLCWAFWSNVEDRLITCRVFTDLPTRLRCSLCIARPPPCHPHHQRQLLSARPCPHCNHCHATTAAARACLVPTTMPPRKAFATSWHWRRSRVSRQILRMLQILQCHRQNEGATTPKCLHVRPCQRRYDESARYGHR